MKPTTKNIVLGAGHVYFDELDADGNHVGERYLAETPGFSITVEATALDDWSSDGQVAEKHLSVVTQIARDASLTLKDISASNLALFLMGTADTDSTSAGAVTADPINGGQGVKQGRWYQLGVDSTHPAGVRAITTLVIKDAVPSTYVKDTDYEEDLDLGRIYIIPGGGIADDTVITADFAETDATWEQVTSADLGAARGALRYVASNTRGTNRDVFLPLAEMRPSGEMAWKSRDTVQQMQFAVAINTPGDGRAAIYVNGRAA